MRYLALFLILTYYTALVFTANLINEWLLLLLLLPAGIGMSYLIVTDDPYC